MIDALAELVVAFPGRANRTRCFTHILNLVVKVILRPFDGPKDNVDEMLIGASRALVDPAGDIEMHEGDEDEIEEEEEEEWVHPHDGMSQGDRDDLDLTVRPVRSVLVKVTCSKLRSREHSRRFKLRKLAFAIKNSTTFLLPRWTQLLQDMAKETSDPLPIRMMPRDVATRWNSTYEMLAFALDYREAIDGITGDRDMRKYELSEDEWGLVQQLGDVLQVSFILLIVFPFEPLAFRRYSRTLRFSFPVRRRIFPL
jgi:hypothetical protein